MLLREIPIPENGVPGDLFARGILHCEYHHNKLYQFQIEEFVLDNKLEWSNYYICFQQQILLAISLCSPLLQLKDHVHPWKKNQLSTSLI